MSQCLSSWFYKALVRRAFNVLCLANRGQLFPLLSLAISAYFVGRSKTPPFSIRSILVHGKSDLLKHSTGIYSTPNTIHPLDWNGSICTAMHGRLRLHGTLATQSIVLLYPYLYRKKPPSPRQQRRGSEWISIYVLGRFDTRLLFLSPRGILIFVRLIPFRSSPSIRSYRYARTGNFGSYG